MNVGALYSSTASEVLTLRERNYVQTYQKFRSGLTEMDRNPCKQKSKSSRSICSLSGQRFAEWDQGIENGPSKNLLQLSYCSVHCTTACHDLIIRTQNRFIPSFLIKTYMKMVILDHVTGYPICFFPIFRHIHITDITSSHGPEPPSSSVPGPHLRESLGLGIPWMLQSPGHRREYRLSPTDAEYGRNHLRRSSRCNCCNCGSGNAKAKIRDATITSLHHRVADAFHIHIVFANETHINS